MTLSPFSLPFLMANFALPSSVALYISVTFIKFMTMYAVCLLGLFCSEMISVTRISTASSYFQMLWINAQWIFAKVIDYFACGYFSEMILVAPPMGVHVSPEPVTTSEENSIPSVSPASPNPTPFWFFTDKFPEPDFGWERLWSFLGHKMQYNTWRHHREVLGLE